MKEPLKSLSIELAICLVKKNPMDIILQKATELGVSKIFPCLTEYTNIRKINLKNLKDKYDIINIKLDKTGGLTEALNLKSIALIDGYKIMVGCMVGSSLAMAPATLLAQGIEFVDLDGPLLLSQDRNYPLKYDLNGVYPPEKELWG